MNSSNNSNKATPIAPQQHHAASADSPHDHTGLWFSSSLLIKDVTGVDTNQGTVLLHIRGET